MQGAQWIFLKCFYQINGELFLEGHPPETLYLKIVELMLGNVLMLNLLIAIYGEVFGETTRDSSLNWKYEWFILITEHQARFTFTEFQKKQQLLNYSNQQ